MTMNKKRDEVYHALLNINAPMKAFGELNTWSNDALQVGTAQEIAAQIVSQCRDLTKQELITAVRALGIVVRFTELSEGYSEVRVNYKDGDESTAYYTDDRQDALDTARRMAAERAQQLAGPCRHGNFVCLECQAEEAFVLAQMGIDPASEQARQARQARQVRVAIRSGNARDADPSNELPDRREEGNTYEAAMKSFRFAAASLSEASREYRAHNISEAEYGEVLIAFRAAERAMDEEEKRQG